MEDIITSYLLQTKECSLPGIGKLRILTAPAELDIANHLIFPPKDEILFTGRPDKVADELISYIAIKKNTGKPQAEQQFRNWCKNANELISSGQKLTFTSIGSLQKNSAGNIFLHCEKKLNLFEPIPAERVIHKDAEHSVLVGDKETTSSAMTQFLKEEEVVNNGKWKTMAVILLLIALSILFLFYYFNSFSGFGNQAKHTPAVPPATYITQ